MKLQTNRTVDTNFTGESQDFSIAVNGKAFNILLDGLYSNKIRAVVRELWTNAFDAHIAAGREDVPFDCHLPTAMNPTFVVRDYGVSLTHDGVMQLYTTLFKSTKDASNDAVGALGLGSKSPFAYTDSFTVIARMNGTKRTYLAYMKADGTPSINFLGEVESDEAEGLEVSLAVKDEDFADFEREARIVATGFDPLPVIDGCKIQAARPVLVDEDKNFAVFNTADLPDRSRLMVRQGCVIYPVNDYSVVRNIEDTVKYGYSLVVNVPIGAVSIAASREALSMDDPTRKAVLEAATKSIELAKKNVLAELNEKPTLFDAQAYWFGDKRSNLSTVFNFHPRWRGNNLPNYIEMPKDSDDKPMEMKKGNRKGVIALRHVPFNTRKEFKFVVRNSNNKVVREMMRYREFVSENGGNQADVYLLTDPDPKMLAALKAAGRFDDSQFYKTADLPDSGPAQRGPRGGPKKISGVYKSNGSYSWEAITKGDGLPEDFWWMEVPRVTRGANSDCNRMAQSLETYGLEKLPVLMVTNGAIKRHKLDAKRNLIPVYKAAEKQAQKRRIQEYAVWQAGQQIKQLIGLTKLPKNLVDAAAEPRYAQSAHITWADKQESRTITDRLVAPYKERYPLLFGVATGDAVKAYVAAVDNAQEAS